MWLRKLVLLLLPLLSIRAQVPKEIQALANQARGLPPEFAADVLLKLAASPLVNDPKWKRGAVEDAFLSAAHAQSPYRKLGDRRVSLDAVMSLHLEALTLQTSAVEAMLALDAQRALTMFRDTPAPNLPKLSCQEALTPDVSAYYQTAAALFTSAFTPAKRRKEEDIAFLRDHISAIESPSQVAPALKLLDQVELSEQIRSGLIASFAAALERVNGGDREFAASESLLVSAAVPGMHEAGFLATLRAYIVRHASGPRCSDQIKAGQLPESATQFNKLILQIDPDGTQFHPIADEEAAPLRDDGTYPAPYVGQSPHARQVAAALAALRNENRSSAEWTAHYYDALKLIESWKPEDESSPEDYLLMFTADYNGLLDYAPEGPARRSTLESYVHFLETVLAHREPRPLVLAVSLATQSHAPRRRLGGTASYRSGPGVVVR